MKTLETERLILREWTLDDAEDMFAYASGEKVGPMAGWKPHESVEESESIIKMFIDEDETWAIELKENHKVIGSVGLHKRKRPGLAGERELGYVLSEAYWGQGLIPEAAKRVLQFAFEELDLECVNVCHFDFNEQSKRVIEKLGAVHMKSLEKSWKRPDGAELNEEVYEIRRKN